MRTIILKLLRRFANKKNPKTQTLFVDGKGNVWKGYVDNNEIPPVRFNYASYFASMADLCMTKERMELLAKAAKQANDKGKKSEVAIIMNEFELCSVMFNELEIMRNLIACYLLLNDEKPDVFNGHVHKKKVGLLTEDPETEAFFLPMGQQLITSYLKGYRQKTLTELRAENDRLSHLRLSTDSGISNP
jgi:hypothetical protein